MRSTGRQKTWTEQKVLDCQDEDSRNIEMSKKMACYLEAKSFSERVTAVLWYRQQLDKSQGQCNTEECRQILNGPQRMTALYCFASWKQLIRYWAHIKTKTERKNKWMILSVTGNPKLAMRKTSNRSMQDFSGFDCWWLPKGFSLQLCLHFSLCRKYCYFNISHIVGYWMFGVFSASDSKGNRCYWHT